MKKKNTLLIIAGLALAFTGLQAQETPDYAQIVADTNAIEDKATRLDEKISVGDQYGPDLLTRLEAGEHLGRNETDVLLWASQYWSSNPDLVLIKSVIPDHYRQLHPRYPAAVRNMIRAGARNGAFTDAEILDHIEQYPAEDASRKLARYYSWSNESVRLSAWKAIVESRVGTGLAKGWWILAFKRARRTLPLSEQIALTKAEVDGLLAANRSEAQNEWMTEASADLMALKLQQ